MDVRRKMRRVLEKGRPFIFNRKEKNLHLNFFDLVGNFKINRKESERILKDVTEIKDKL